MHELEKNSNSVILETRQGADELNLMQLNNLIHSLLRISVIIKPYAPKSSVIAPGEVDNNMSLSLEEALEEIQNEEE